MGISNGLEEPRSAVTRKLGDYTLHFGIVGTTGKVRLGRIPNSHCKYIYVKIGKRDVYLGRLEVIEDADSGLTSLTLCAAGAEPNVRFKYLQCEVTRQVPVNLWKETTFYICTDGNRVKAVMIVNPNEKS